MDKPTIPVVDTDHSDWSTNMIVEPVDDILHQMSTNSEESKEGNISTNNGRDDEGVDAHSTNDNARVNYNTKKQIGNVRDYKEHDREDVDKK